MPEEEKVMDLTNKTDDEIVALFTDVAEEVVARAIQNRAAEALVDRDADDAEELQIALEEAAPDVEDA